MGKKSFRAKTARKNINKNTQSKLNNSILGHEFQESLSYDDNLESRFFVQHYCFLIRGLQRRNWVQVETKLTKMKCPRKLLSVLKASWTMFKVMRALRPRQSKNLVYIMKNFCTLEGQKIFDDCYEQYVEQPYETTINFYQNRGYDSRYFRLAEYFYNEEDEWVIPMTLFPRINFEKSKMHLAFEPYELGPELVKEAHDRIFKYLMKLDVKRIFMPKADVLQKHGNQKYNDGGIVRYDYERPTISFDSSFKYQRFLTQPLTPREVWLPGKAIKQNNVFFMQLHRQFLKADPVYPSPDSEVNHERIKKYLKDGFLKFDISGFGFQYLRELLKIGNRCIQELYPCTTLDEQCEIFERILDNVKVEMPDGTFKYPQRGIGLGYYEDLKTIVMLALLDHLDPISVYGDQGLLPPFALSFAEDLQKFQFIMNWEKIDLALRKEKPNGEGVHTPSTN
jgi:hypothetical protein